MGFGNYGKKATTKEEPKYTLIKDFGALSEEEGKYVKRLRLVQWNGNEPKFDIRPWKTTEENGEQCLKGITLSSEEIEHLYKLLQKIDSEEEAAETKE